MSGTPGHKKHENSNLTGLEGALADVIIMETPPELINWRSVVLLLPVGSMPVTLSPCW